MLKSRSVEEREITAWGSSERVSHLSGDCCQTGLANWTAHCAGSCPVFLAVLGMEVHLLEAYGNSSLQP